MWSFFFTQVRFSARIYDRVAKIQRRKSISRSQPKKHMFLLFLIYIMFGNFLLFLWKHPIAMTVEPLWLLEKNCEK